MILTEPQINEVIKQASLAFPNFNNWDYNNEINEEYLGFSLWGKFSLYPEDLMSGDFFITLETDEEKWRGCLTIGQPSYFWSSADVGDANLLSIDYCDSLEQAITSLKAEILRFCQAFSIL